MTAPMMPALPAAGPDIAPVRVIDVRVIDVGVIDAGVIERARSVTGTVEAWQ
jgi:hypothetical protein